MSAIRLCRDCKHFDFLNDTCGKSPMPFDYVHGTKTGFYKAQAERETMNGCGKEARWFEPKEGA